GGRYEGFAGANAATIAVGKVSAEARRLVETTRECLEAAVRECIPGKRLSDIGRAVQARAEKGGYGIVRDYAGHGIGSKMHEDPQVPNYVDASTLRRDLVLREGL